MTEPVKIRQAVIPVAGLGSRFLPATKTVAKELLPLLDRPCLQLVIEEAVASGVEEIIIVLSPEKQALREYFQPNERLNHWLAVRGQTERLEELKRIETMARYVFITQPEPLGLGHAVGCARPAIRDEHFLVILPDDIIDAEVPACRQLVDVFSAENKPVISVMPVQWEEVNRYGIVRATPLSDSLGTVQSIIEKPKRDLAPSNLAVIGRYLLPRTIFDTLDQVKPGSGGEIQLTDALTSLVDSPGLISCAFEGERFDTGIPLGLLKASLNYATRNPAVRDEMRTFIKTLAAVL